MQAKMADIKYWYEDLPQGREFHYPERYVGAEEIIRFATEFDPQPFHLSEEAGKNSILGGLSASGWHTCAMVMRMYFDTFIVDSSGEGAPGIDFVEWRKPVLAGDKLSGTTVVLDARPLKSRPGVGMVRMRHTIVNQRGETVMLMENPAMMRMRGSVAP
jgi:acyl dehydratase